MHDDSCRQATESNRPTISLGECPSNRPGPNFCFGSQQQRLYTVESSPQLAQLHRVPIRGLSVDMYTILPVVVPARWEANIPPYLHPYFDIVLCGTECQDGGSVGELIAIGTED